MAYYRTKYETIMTAPDGRKFLLLYTESRSFSGLIGCVRNRAADLLSAIARGEDAEFTREGKGRYPVVRFDNGWTATYSGRTQLEARTAGEYPWIFDGATV